MYPANITRANASARAGMLATRTYEILVDLTGRDPDGRPLAEPEENFVTTSVIRFTSSAGLTVVDVIADEILGASLDDEPIDTSRFDGARLSLDLSEGRHELSITAMHRYSRSGQGLHRFVDPADGRVYLYT
ncbi:MAG: aminopeptidase N, partial [Propionibacteriaceae bacterium]|nr:aminopeptidase N [Propionibacteriaceae bacterium]